MNQDFITKAEFFVLIALGVVFPWAVVTISQTRMYIKRNMTKVRVVASSIVTLILTAVVGVVLWATVPSLTVSWQLAVLRLPNSAANILAFVPLLPMTASALVVAFPVTAVFLKWRANA